MGNKVIAIRAGHSPNCRGAVGIRDEWSSMNALYGVVAQLLIDAGNTVINCNSTANTDNQELRDGANKANAHKVDIFVSFHMNASKNHNAYGAEAWVHSRNSRAVPIAQKMLANWCALGFHNRGVKYDYDDGDLDYYEMRGVNAPNIIFETCFCDSDRDINIWSPTPWDTLARAIANALDPSIPLKKPADRYAVQIYSFNKEDATAAQKKVKEAFPGWYSTVTRLED